MPLIDLRGWLPVDAVVHDGRPGLAWMEMSGVRLAEPFFEQTVARVKSESPKRSHTFTEFDTLVQLERSFTSVSPSGFIFHSSRCGSTLLANACRAIEGAIVLSEAAPLDKLIARFITDIDEPRIKEAIYSILVRAVVAALGQKRFGDERHLFIKFGCSSVSQIERILRLWPRVPWVFLYRDPVETIVSNMQNRPAWLADDDHRVLASITGTSPAEVAKMVPEELCARSLGSFYAAAHRVANERALLLNYNQLSPTVIAGVLKFFGVQPAATELESITRATQKYSKSTSGDRVFVADAETKQQAATDLVRRMAALWASETYQLLEQKRLDNSDYERK